MNRISLAQDARELANFLVAFANLIDEHQFDCELDREEEFFNSGFMVQLTVLSFAKLLMENMYERT